MFERLHNALRESTISSGGDGEDETGPDDELPDADSITPGEAHVTAISPSSVRIESETVRAENTWCKTLFISDWPDTAEPGMLDMVTSYPSSEVDVSMHATPRDQQRAIKQFESAIRDLKSQRIAEEEAGNASTETQRRIKEHQEILAQLEEGIQSVFDVSLYITVRSALENRTEKVARKIGNELQRQQLQTTSVDYRQEAGLSSASPIAKDVLAYDIPDVATPMLGRGVGALFPFAATTIIEEDGVLYGQHATTGSPVIIDRFARPNGYNIFTAGVVGAGKSYGTKLLNLRRLAKERDTLLVMLDPMDGFRELADGLNAERVTVDGTRGLNPLEIRPTPAHVLEANPQLQPFRQALSGALGFFEEFFKSVGADEVALSKTERSVLSEAVRTAYANAGITEDPATHHNDSPTVIDVIGVLAEIEDDPEAYVGQMEADDDLLELDDAPPQSDRTLATWQTAASELRVAMHPFRTAEYAHLAGASDIDIHDADTTYLDLQQGEGERELGMMMQLLLDSVYQRTKQSDKRVILCIDEAHYLMQNEGSLEWMERLTRHSRHHDLSLHLVTQEASDFLIHEKAKTIANNCSQKILHRLPGLSDDHANALGLTDREATFVRKAKPGTPERGYSNALVNVQDDATLPLKVWAYSREEAIIEGETATEETKTETETDSGGETASVEETD